MYGLTQEGQISNDALLKLLEPYGYQPSRKTPVIWTHKSWPISFTLVVDEFGVKYSRKEHTLHLKEELEKNTR